MIKLTDEARKAAREAAKERWITGSSDTTQMLLAVDAALAAALPHLEGATPVATKAAVEHALNLHWWDEDNQPCACGFDFIAAGQSFKMHLADAFLAAGVFREGATPAIDREALVSLFELSGVGHDALMPSLYRSELADKVLALIGGAS